MPQNIADTVMMIRPVCFGFNPQTAESNAFQNKVEIFSDRQIQEMALLEFNGMVQTLEEVGIKVLTFNDILEPHTPDSIFPNNWISTSFGKLITYPMANKIRSDERRTDIIQDLKEKYGLDEDHSLVAYESENKYLEGTGSLVIDHSSKRAYAALSPRTDEEVLKAYCDITGLTYTAFKAYGPEGEEIYHTNVMMTIADEYAVIGPETIEEGERERVLSQLKADGKDIIELSTDQVHKHFAGNMMQLQNDKVEKFLIMSSEAFSSLTDEQKDIIEKTHQNKILPIPINLIETIGGGSVRCMVAEVFY